MLKATFNAEYKGKKVKDIIVESWLAFPIAFIAIALFIGWFMNLENVFTYFPGFEQFNQIETVGQMPMKFVISLIGVFVFFLGSFTGFIW